jgi:hypothetical protein
VAAAFPGEVAATAKHKRADLVRDLIAKPSRVGRKGKIRQPWCS